MLEKLKQIVTPKGLTVEEYLNEKYPDGKWIVDGELITFEAKVQHLTLLYKWKVNGDSIEAISGKACELTPDYNVRLQEINEKKKIQNPKDVDIFELVQKYEQDYETKDAISKVSKDIGISEEEVLDIYDKVSRAIYL